MSEKSMPRNSPQYHKSAVILSRCIRRSDRTWNAQNPTKDACPVGKQLHPTNSNLTEHVRYRIPSNLRKHPSMSGIENRREWASQQKSRRRHTFAVIGNSRCLRQFWCRLIATAHSLFPTPIHRNRFGGLRITRTFCVCHRALHVLIRRGPFAKCIRREIDM